MNNLKLKLWGHKSRYSEQKEQSNKTKHGSAIRLDNKTFYKG